MSNRKIFIVIGTKAQLIKMAPIMIELDKKKIDYRFIFTGQHKETIQELVDTFHLKVPDYILYKGEDITKVPQMAFWAIRCLVHTVINGEKIFGGEKGIVLVHGDAFSALLGAMMAKISRLKVACVESGLRSFNLFHPFPEEITRRLLSSLTDYHFCPGEFAYKNSLKHKGIKLNTRFNTLLDSLRIAQRMEDKVQIDIPTGAYCLASIHRFENIFNKKRFSSVLETIREISKQIKVLFILHRPTREKLAEYGFYKGLKENQNIELKPRYGFFKFNKLLRGAEFVITDGGSNQEECHYLGKPCLVMRKITERRDEMGQNIVISNYNRQIISDFVNHYPKYKLPPHDFRGSPSKIIVDYLTKWQA